MQARPSYALWLLGLLALLFPLVGPAQAGWAGPATAAPQATWTVCPAGPPTCDFATLQAAVDAAGPGDLIQVAEGTYSDLHARPPLPGYNGPSVITQVLYLSETLTIRGGYDTSFSEPPDPVAHPTIVDPQGQGRALYIGGEVSPVLEGLRLSNGNAAGLGGGPWGNHVGGGLYVVSATLTVERCFLLDNQASSLGGGAFVLSGQATFRESTFSGNQASYGGGLYSSIAQIVLEDSTFRENSAFSGAAVYLFGGVSEVRGNTFSANQANGRGGGLYFLIGSNTVERNRIISNTASMGGAAFLEESTSTWSNNWIAANRGTTEGSALYIRGAGGLFGHNTIARNPGSSGLYVTNSSGTPGDVEWVNTILVSHTIALSVTAGSTTTLEATLWGSGRWANGRDWSGPGVILTGTVNLWDDPAFVNPDGDDYHLTRASAALHSGVYAGILVDIDGQPRPLGPGYDIGADEFSHDLSVGKTAEPMLVEAGSSLTFHLLLTNTGYLPLTAQITDVLPAQVTPGGVLTWTGQVVAAGDTWSQDVVVTVDSGYGGPLVNLLQVSTAEGLGGSDAVTVTVVAATYEVMLPLVYK